MVEPQEELREGPPTKRRRDTRGCLQGICVQSAGTELIVTSAADEDGGHQSIALGRGV